MTASERINKRDSEISKPYQNKKEKERAFLKEKIQWKKALIQSFPENIAVVKSYREASYNPAVNQRKLDSENLERRAHKYLIQEDRYTRQFFLPFKDKKRYIISKLKNAAKQKSTDCSQKMIKIVENFYSQLYAES